MRILAIDPGYDRLGIAVVEGDPSKPRVVWSDCITPEVESLEKRLASISTAVETAIAEYRPEALGIETLFFNLNKKTALKVAEARGTVLSVAGLHRLFVVECSPQQIKLAVTGHGGADKKAVAQMIPHLVSLLPKKRLDDEFDAIAVGITALAFAQRINPQAT
jgi:crossover junction endodeoxyribonuclease RuvC